jgi:hypothetical protein
MAKEIYTMKKLLLPIFLSALLLGSCQATSTGGGNNNQTYYNPGTAVPTISEKDKCISYFKKVNNYSDSLKAYQLESILYNEYDSSSNKRVKETADFYYYDKEDNFSIALEMKLYKGSATTSDTPYFSQFISLNFSFQRLSSTYDKASELFTYFEPGYNYFEMESISNCVFGGDGKMTNCTTTQLTTDFPSSFSTTISNCRGKTCDYFNLSIGWINSNCDSWGFAQPW